MFNKLILFLGLCALAVACGVPHVDQPASKASEPARQETGPITVTSFDGVEIAATVHRLGRPTLILVHGWMCDQTYWDLQVPALSEHFGVVTVDTAGHGLSGTARRNWTIASLGQDVTAVIRHLGLDDVIVVGHSMGGKVGLEVARLMPGTVIGVLGVDTLQDADYKVDPEQTEAFLTAMETDFGAGCDPFVTAMFGEGAEPALIDHITEDMCTGPAEVGAALLRAYVAFDDPTAFQKAGVPIRCVNADKWPTNTEANRRYADFDVVILQGPGHFLMQEAPDELNGALVEMVESMWPVNTEVEILP